MKIFNIHKQNLFFNKQKIFVLIGFVCLQNFIFAQKASVSIDTTKIRIGEQVNIHLNVTLPITAKIFWPKIGDSLTKNVEVIKATHVDTTTTSRSDFLNYSQIIKITSFDTGVQVIPPFVINYTYGSQNSMQQLTTDNVTITVQGIAVDTTKAIKDIKPNMEAPITISEIIPYVIGSIIFVIVILLLIYYIKRRKQNKPIIPIVSTVELPAWQMALNNLDVLNAQKIWQSGRVKDYYTFLTDILREYLFKQYHIDAKEMTSYEIMDALSKETLQQEEKNKLEVILSRSDYAKFAKAKIGERENIESLEYAKDFILHTKDLDISTPNTQNIKTE